jgi:hypothetical protein
MPMALAKPFRRMSQASCCSGTRTGNRATRNQDRVFKDKMNEIDWRKAKDELGMVKDVPSRWVSWH